MAAPEKKTSLNSEVPFAREAVQQYEALRRGALGASVPPSERRGLTVLYRRGMVAWARAVARPATDPGERPSRPSPAQQSFPGLDHELAQLLAGMTLAVATRSIAC